MTDAQLIAKHRQTLTEAHRARASGRADDAYRLARECLRLSSEMKLRMMERCA